jgi:hypothetical protein
MERPVTNRDWELPRPRIANDQIVALRVAFAEVAVRERVKQAREKWNALRRTLRHNSGDENQPSPDEDAWAMLNTVRAVVREGKIELLEPVDLPEGTTVLVTPLIEEDTLFWARVSHVALDAVWDNAEDDVYAQLLQEG